MAKKKETIQAYIGAVETNEEKKSRWICQAVEIVSRLEGNHGYANISDNFDGQGISCGVMNWNLGQGTLIGLFPDDLIIREMDEHAELFMSMVKPHQSQIDRITKALELQKDRKKWMAFCDDLTCMLQSKEGIEVQNKVIEKTLAKSAFANMPDSYPSFRAFLFMFDVAVQNGSLKNLKFGDKVADVVLAKEIDSNLKLNNHQHLLVHLAHLRANKCNPLWKKDVLNRKLFIATSEKNERCTFDLPSHEAMEERI